MNTIILTLLLLITSGMVSANQYLSYVAVDPCRIVDTREGRGVISAGDFRNFRATGSTGELAVQGGTECPNPMLGIKPQAVSAYVLVLPHGVTGGVATAYPSDKLPPPVGAGSTVNFGLGRVTGNTTNITLCEEGFCPADGEFAVLARSTGFNLVVDVQGYFYPMPTDPDPESTERFVDNGDGTISDHETGLMWEKKLPSDHPECPGSYPDSPGQSPHCVYNYYSGIKPASAANNVITGFLAKLNQKTTYEGRWEYPGDAWDSTCFADYCDWRLPKMSELKSIFLESRNETPCTYPIFEPTAAYPNNEVGFGPVGYITDTNFGGMDNLIGFGGPPCSSNHAFPSNYGSGWARAVRRFKY